MTSQNIVRRTLGRTKLAVHRAIYFTPKIKNWWVYLLDAVGMLHAETLHTFRYRNGLNVLFRAGTFDSLINVEVFGYHEYGTHFMSDVKDFSRFIDLGAQTGVFTMYMLSRNSSSRGVCVEATNENFVILEKNIDANDLSGRVTLLHKAVWSDTGEKLVIHMSTHNTGGHSVVIDDAARFDGETVTTISLKDVVGAEVCDVLKIDIEGAEYDVLYRTDADTLSRIRHIVMEAHHIDDGARNAPALASHLEKVGFHVDREGRHIWATNTSLNFLAQ